MKVNAVERLRAELRSSRWRRDHIAMGTNTDPYQKAEGKYHLTQGIVRVLSEEANPFSILTKSTLVLRDLDLLVAASERTRVNMAMSIGTLDREVWRLTEPGTPPPDKRLEAVARLNQAGVPCGVLIAPVLPGLSDSDEQLRAVAKACLEAGAVSVTPVALHLRPGVREHYLEWLASVRPELLALHAERFKRGSYQPRAEQERINEIVREVGRASPHRSRWRRGVSHEPAEPDSAPPRRPDRAELVLLRRAAQVALSPRVLPRSVTNTSMAKTKDPSRSPRRAPATTPQVAGTSEPTRCSWAGGDPMRTYHDQEWGVPVHDDVRHFEFLVLESAQAGLSWATILKRRDGYRHAFCDFDPQAVARFGPGDVGRLLGDSGIIRNRLKIESAIKNARAFLEICEESGSFDDYIWRFVGGAPVVNAWTTESDIPAETPLSSS